MKRITDPSRVVIVDGVRFVKEKRKSGYWYPSQWQYRKVGRLPALHIYMWEKAHGMKVPAGYDVHHKDFNKDNNAPSNLVALTPQEHHRIHAEALTDEQRKDFAKRLNEKARPLAVKWHKSIDGRKWHKEHYERMGSRLHEMKDLKCEYCGKTFRAEKGRFCCNAHKSAWRRKMHLDDVVRVCDVCGKEFSVNKYEETRTCSLSAGRRFVGGRRSMERYKKKAVKVKRVVRLKEREPVFDLTVPKNHNFVVNDGIVVHNCRYGTFFALREAGILTI